MKFITITFMLVVCLVIFTSCVFTDDICYRETHCNYTIKCETSCDSFGRNCVLVECYDILDKCWSECVYHN